MVKKNRAASADADADSPELELNKLRNQRDALIAEVDRFSKYLSKPEACTTQIAARIERHKTILEKFTEIQSEIECLGESSENVRETFENDYYEVLANATTKLKETAVRQEPPITHVLPNTNTIDANEVRLPTINLPVFDGAYEDWYKFYDSFNNIVHANKTLSNVQKFIYLSLSLKDSAAETIQSLEVTAENYIIALDLLKERYDNKKIIVNSHIKAVFELQPITRETSVSLRQLLDTLTRHLRALEALKLPVKQWDALLIHLLLSKLDNNTRKLWELSLTGNDLPELDNLIKFLKTRCAALEVLSSNSSTNTRTNATKPRTLANVSTGNISCILCKSAHVVYQCKNFLSKDPDQRLAIIKDKKACTNCLATGHPTQKCKSVHNCFKCRKRHHTLLHRDVASTSAGSNAEVEDNNVAMASHAQNHNTHVFLSTADVYIKDKAGRNIKARALIDNGSDSNYITERLFLKLGLKQLNRKHSLQITGIGGSVTHTSKFVNAIIASMHNKYEKKLQFLVIDRITEKIPVVAINSQDIDLPNNIKLADDNYNVPNEIDILIGAEIFYNIIKGGKIELGRDKPVLRDTEFGWLVTGRMNITHEQQKTCNLSIQANNELHNELQRFWKLDECPEVELTSSEDKICEDHFISTTARDKNGRYIVQLPFNENKAKIGPSFHNALTRFLNTEKRLQRNETLRREYSQFMSEYESLGHMRKILELPANFQYKNNSSNESYGTEYYIPHHAVVKDSSSTTKVRVVFDASAQPKTGCSLNNALIPGPTLQSELFAILLRFRQYNIVISADIEKMFRQVQVAETDKPFQKIIWRNDPSENLNVYELQTVTYGTAPATYLTTRCLKDLASRSKENFPKAAHAIMYDTYVDDVITGCDTTEQAIELKNELTSILEDGCFNLRKWCSNSIDVLKDCLTTNKTTKHLVKEKGDNRTLGIIWISETDNLNFINSATLSDNVTKRTILSAIARIFDPLGLLAPITVSIKILLQTLWLKKLDWDDPAPDDTRVLWSNLIEDINFIFNIEVPRKVICDNPVKIELCGFSDSSQKAYGAAVYVKSTDQSGRTAVNLLCAKSRVAPVKELTIARLELLAAELLTKLINYVKSNTRLDIVKTHYFTDSSIVMHWLNGEPRKWKTFVAHRVAKIQNLCSIDDWYHINSENNPADIVSRGISASNLKESTWFSGPAFLYQSAETWPVNNVMNNTEVQEQRKVKITLNAIVEIDLFNKYSSYERLLRITALLYRFCKNCSLPKGTRQIGPLNAVELNSAKMTLIKAMQGVSFAKEISKINNAPKTSKLACLSPFLDKNGILRVGGRISRADLDYDMRHQIILPTNHSFTDLIIKHIHDKHFHAGLQATLSAVREQYWPVNAKTKIKKIIRSCIICFKYSPTHINIKMSDLPKTRITPARPFLYTSLDMAGPFLTKETKFRNKKIVKTYVCVYVCFVTRAVHLELTSDLTLTSFLNCLKRFVARRGLPKQIYSDNAKTFVAANKELRQAFVEMIKFQQGDEISSFLAENSITWKYMPPRSPHFGGLHEAAVKSMKIHLKKVISDSVLTVENLNTIICQIESILNSRPLCPCSDDPTDLTPLTPGHFLIGAPLTALPQVDVSQVEFKRLKLYEQLQQRVQHFWKRWTRDYLTNLQTRSKWQGDGKRQLKINDLVLVNEPNSATHHWPLARVVALHPGPDGRIRTATIRMKGSEVRRAAINLCPLPTKELVEISDFNGGEYVRTNVLICATQR